MFLAHVPNFLGKKFFSGKFGSAKHNFTTVSSTMPNLQKTNDAIPRKCPERDRKMDGRTEGQTKGRPDPVL